MGGEAKFPLRLGASRLRRAFNIAECYMGIDPNPARAMAEDMLFGERPLLLALFDSFDIAEVQEIEVDSYFRDSITVTSSLTVTLVEALIERFAVSTAVTPGAHMTAQLAENLGLSDRITPILLAVLTDTATLSAALSGTPQTTLAIVDALVLSGIANSTVQAMAMLTEALSFATAMTAVYEGQIADAADFAATLDTTIQAYEVLIVNAVFAASLTGLAMLTGLVEETATFDDTLTPRQYLLAHIADGLDLSVGFVFDDVPYLGIAMNAKNKAVSTYTNYAYNSLTEYRGRMYGASDDGLFLLEGDTDNGDRIDWRLRTGLTRFGDKQEKRIESAEIGHTASGRVVLKVVQSTLNATTRLPELREFWYEMVPGTKGAGAVREGRFKPGQGLKAVYWAFELASLDPVTSGDSIDMLNVRPLLLKRRIT